MSLVCDQCGEPAVVIAPGSEEIRELFLLAPGRAMHCWCLKCWVRDFGARQREEMA